MKTNYSQIIRKTLSAVIAVSLVGAFSALTPRSSMATADGEEMASHESHDKDAEGNDTIAIGGYDPVAYFTLLDAVKGSEQYTYEWLGDKWQFSNEEHMNLFVADSMHYMPNYGGYCSFDPVSRGHDHDVDPTIWRIVNDKLYLFYSEQIAGEKLPADEWKKVKAGLAQ